MAVEVEPFGIGSFLRSRELDFLDARKEVILHAVEHRLVFDEFVLFLVHLDGIDYEQQQLQQEQEEGRQEQRRGIDQHLEDVDHRENQRDQGSEDGIVGQGAELPDGGDAVGDFSRRIFPEETGVEREHPGHDCHLQVDAQYVLYPQYQFVS